MPAKKKVQERIIIRLARLGAQGEGGVARYYYQPTGKMYRREQLYALDKNLADELLATGKFERIHQDDLTRAKKEAKAGRGMTLADRQKIKRREAMLRKRRRPVLADDAGAIETDDGLLDTGAEGAEETEGDDEEALSV